MQPTRGQSELSRSRLQEAELEQDAVHAAAREHDRDVAVAHVLIVLLADLQRHPYRARLAAVEPHEPRPGTSSVEDELVEEEERSGSTTPTTTTAAGSASAPTRSRARPTAARSSPTS